ncbi:Pro-Pol polyprotein [Dictyocoela muelleri]|nr:Pro-Pol polyprotein [Dictyocoela muelleri]
MTSLYYNLKRFYKIDNIKSYIKKIIINCEKCIRCKKLKKSKIIRHKINSEKLMDVLCSDIFGPFDLSYFKHEEIENKGFILTITDVFSKFTKVKFCTSITSKTIIEEINKWINKYGIPRKFICDNGRQYLSKEINTYFKRLNVLKICTPIYHPSSNDISERLNQTVAEVLRIFKGKSIYTIESLINKRLNINHHRSIQEQPSTIIYGYSEYDLYKNKELNLPNLKSNQDQENKSLKIIYNNFKIGDYAYIKNFNNNKSEDLYIGPYEIVKISKKHLWYKIKNIKEWIHINDIKMKN